jgi:hypothetical protein
MAAVYDNFGLVYQDLRKFNYAISYYYKSLKLKLLFYGREHPFIADSYNYIGTLHH